MEKRVITVIVLLALCIAVAMDITLELMVTGDVRQHVLERVSYKAGGDNERF